MVHARSTLFLRVIVAAGTVGAVVILAGNLLGGAMTASAQTVPTAPPSNTPVPPATDTSVPPSPAKTSVPRPTSTQTATVTLPPSATPSQTAEPTKVVPTDTSAPVAPAATEAPSPTPLPTPAIPGWPFGVIGGAIVVVLLIAWAVARRRPKG